MVFQGQYSALIESNADIFYQPLNYTLTKYTVFGFAMLAPDSISDIDWHEITLTITQQGLAPIRLHYVLQGTTPADTGTDKFFYLACNVGQWRAENRPLINDLTQKSITQYAGGTVTNITCQEGGVCTTVYDALSLLEYNPLSGPTPNAIVNGGFEYQNFTGWTVEGDSIIDYNKAEVYEGFFSACNNHYYDSFYQTLSFPISINASFSAAMLALGPVDDVDWHEIMLTINESGLGTAYIHYRLQASQPTDTTTDKYFLIGGNSEQWYVLNRSVWNDLVSRGLNPGSGWTISQVTCQQNGMCNTVYDAFRLWNGPAITTTGGGSGNSGGSSLGNSGAGLSLSPAQVLGSFSLGVIGVLLIALIAIVKRRKDEAGRESVLTQVSRRSPGLNVNPAKAEQMRGRFCGKCGAYLEASVTNYCPFCGTKLTSG
jgi:hypothetical protein